MAPDGPGMPLVSRTTILITYMEAPSLSNDVSFVLRTLVACSDMQTLTYHTLDLAIDFAAKVYKQAFWMARLGSPTPKRSVLWSSCPAILQFREFARLSKKERADCKEALAKSYKDRSGKSRFTGVKKKLKQSQHHGSTKSLDNRLSYAIPCNDSVLTPCLQLRQYPFGFALRFAKLYKAFQGSEVKWRHPAREARRCPCFTP